MSQNALFSLRSGWLLVMTLHQVQLQTPLSYKLGHPAHVLLLGVYITGHYRMPPVDNDSKIVGLCRETSCQLCKIFSFWVRAAWFVWCVFVLQSPGSLKGSPPHPSPAIMRLELRVRHEMFSNPLSKGAQNNAPQDSDQASPGGNSSHAQVVASWTKTQDQSPKQRHGLGLHWNHLHVLLLLMVAWVPLEPQSDGMWGENGTSCRVAAEWKFWSRSKSCSLSCQERALSSLTPVFLKHRLNMCPFILIFVSRGLRICRVKI